MARLQDRVAIVTGSAQGIGRGIAKAMAKEGALVALWDIKASVRQTARDIADAERKVLSAEVDISDKRNIHFLNYLCKSGSVGLSGYSYSDQLTAGLDKLIDLPYATGNICSLHLVHRLDNNRSR